MTGVWPRGLFALLGSESCLLSKMLTMCEFITRWEKRKAESLALSKDFLIRWGIHQPENERDPLVHIGSGLVLVGFELCSAIVLRLRLCFRIGLGAKEPAMSPD